MKDDLKYKLQIADYLDNLKDGAKIPIEKLTDDEDKFILVVTELILIGEIKDICFTEDYRFVKCERFSSFKMKKESVFNIKKNYYLSKINCNE